MPYRPQRREIYLNLNIWKLIFGVALGLWLGLLAIGGTLWAYYRIVDAQPWVQIGDAASRIRFDIPGKSAAPPAPINQMPPPAPTPPATVPDTNAPAQQPQGNSAAPADSAMFQQYQQNLSEAQQRQVQVERDQRFNSPNCQYWLKQQQSSPTASNQDNVHRACD